MVIVTELDIEMTLDGLAVAIIFWCVDLWAVLGDYFASYSWIYSDAFFEAGESSLLRILRLYELAILLRSDLFNIK